jgi:AcrR family transcriptional regulator
MAGANDRTERADAVRNRQRLLTVALRAFSSGRDEKVTLEAIAKQAGVGIGTLYRHFPTREALVEAAYRDELEQLRARADELLASTEPDVALRLWMDRFADYVAAKRGMADALRAVVASGAIRSSDTRDTLTATIQKLLDAGARARTVRQDISAEDVLATLTGIFLASGAPEQREQAGRMLDLVMDGLRQHRARPTTRQR